MLKKKKSYLVPIIGFSLMMIIGAILLYLPISNKISISFKDALYVAISAISCTGLSKVVPAEQFNFLGQLVMAILMEIGALGFVVFISYMWARKDKKIKMSDIMMVNDNISGDNYNTIREHSLFIFDVMLKVQLFGIIFLGIRFIPEYGIIKGIWYSIFHTISAFANAGFDIIGNNSMYNFRTDIYTQLILTILMVLGSIGVFAIEDLKKNKFKNFNKLRLQTKIIIVYSAILIIVPTILLKVFEPQISVMNSLFMTASTRSTGFSIVNLSDFSNASKLLITILMFIGGSPASTAGGVRIVAIAIIISTMLATLKGRTNTIIFWKKIPDTIVRKAFTTFMIFLLVLLITISIYSFNNNDIDIIDVTLESVSAVTNTGLTTVDGTKVNLVADIVIMILMYIGRMGPIALIAVFLNDEPVDKLVDYPTENVIL